MKIIGRILIYIGFIALFIGVSGMDSQSVIVPVSIGFAGLAMLYAGGKIEEAWT